MLKALADDYRSIGRILHLHASWVLGVCTWRATDQWRSNCRKYSGFVPLRYPHVRTTDKETIFELLQAEDIGMSLTESLPYPAAKERLLRSSRQIFAVVLAVDRRGLTFNVRHLYGAEEKWLVQTGTRRYEDYWYTSECQRVWIHLWNFTAAKRAEGPGDFRQHWSVDGIQAPVYWRDLPQRGNGIQASSNGLLQEKVVRKRPGTVGICASLMHCYQTGPFLMYL